VQWELDPLVGVRPLRFGMSPDEVAAALGDVANPWGAAGGGAGWQMYGDTGITAIYEQGPRLAAVDLPGRKGPLVRFRDIQLIGRVPSEVRADLHELAGQDLTAIRVNWSGDPEVRAWGLSMGAQQAWETSPDGYTERRDALLTNALLVGPELAEDPYRSADVIERRFVRWQEHNPGSWPVKPGQERPRWYWMPRKGVGPLRFGMSRPQVKAALNDELPTYRDGRLLGRPNSDRFDQAGVTAHYWTENGGQVLAAVTVHGRTGPLVSIAGTELIGRSVESVEEFLCQCAESDGVYLRFGPSGDLTLDGLNIWIRAARAGDVAVSEARFCAEGWEWDN
jgi:hypothetical protein